ncbi:MAG: ATP-dependent Clp protease ATP-binding subunit [Clostridia bacterium]|nr:ATP-dependent Clp protease ATP-binding subunit [Clostridia bacterium]
MLDLNFLYAYANNKKKDPKVLASRYLSAQAFTKEEKQFWNRYYEGVISARLTECEQKNVDTINNVDMFLVAIDRMGFPVECFISALKTTPPKESNSIDRFFYKIIPESRIFNSFNELRKRGNVAYFASVHKPEVIPAYKTASDTSYLFTEPAKQDISHLNYFARVLDSMSYELKSKEKVTEMTLSDYEKLALLSTLFVKDYTTMEFDERASRKIKENEKSLKEYLAKLYENADVETFIEKRDVFYEDYLDDFAIDAFWAQEENFLDGLVHIDAKDGELYDEECKEANMISYPDLLKTTVGVEAEKITDLKLGFNITKEQVDKFRKKIVGQNDAVETILDKLTSVACGFIVENKPFASLLLNGPTGVGKTETAKAIAEIFFEDKMYTIDMSNFKHSGDISRLTGSAPGYVGYDEKNGFIEYVKANPSCVLLFDELDKCDPSCLSFMLSVLDEGKFTTAKGEVIDVSNCVIVATTNQKANISNKSHNHNLDEMTSRSGEEGGPFVKEFLGRFDSLLEYTDLSKDELKEVLSVKLDERKASFEKSQKNNNIKIDYTDELLEDILKDAQYKVTGARALNNSIQKKFIRPISRYIIDKGDIKNKQIIVDGGNKMRVDGKVVKTGSEVEEKQVKENKETPLYYYA